MTLPTYTAHCADDIRAAFLDAVEDRRAMVAFTEVRGEFLSIDRLARYLIGCTDVLPATLCDAWDLPLGSPVESLAKILA